MVVRPCLVDRVLVLTLRGAIEPSHTFAGITNLNLRDPII